MPARWVSALWSRRGDLIVDTQMSLPEASLAATFGVCDDIALPQPGQRSSEVENDLELYPGISAVSDAANMTTCPDGCPGESTHCLC